MTAQIFQILIKNKKMDIMISCCCFFSVSSGIAYGSVYIGKKNVNF